MLELGMVNLVVVKTRKNSTEVSMKETTKILMDIFRRNLQDTGIGRKKTDSGNLSYGMVVIWLIRRAYLENIFIQYIND